MRGFDNSLKSLRVVGRGSSPMFRSIFGSGGSSGFIFQGFGRNEESSIGRFRSVDLGFSSTGKTSRHLINDLGKNTHGRHGSVTTTTEASSSLSGSPLLDSSVLGSATTSRCE